jgi:hypothetical protein
MTNAEQIGICQSVKSWLLNTDISRFSLTKMRVNTQMPKLAMLIMGIITGFGGSLTVIIPSITKRTD